MAGIFTVCWWGLGIFGSDPPQSRRERLVRASGRCCCRPGERSDAGILSGLSFRTHAKKPIRQDGLLHYLMPGSSLLSHGETPHYHRRYGVSLLSSAWGQVGPPRCCRQANSVYQHASLHVDLICFKLNIVSHHQQNTFGVVRLSLTVH